MNFHIQYDIIYDNGVFVYIFIGIVILISLLIIVSGIYSVYKTKINFFVTGLDAKFTLPDLSLLWKVSQICELENPTSLFYSLPSLSRCMAKITDDAQKNGTENDLKTQNLISRLFAFRTKLQNESDDKKGLNSTMNLDKGQKLRIILPGKGVFVSEILNNGKELICSVPRQKDLIPISAQDWMDRTVNVYLWRKGDARYVFDTIVINHGLFVGQSSISLKHSSNLIRTQKRKSVRTKCDIQGQLYIIKEAIVDYNAIEVKNGYKCKIEDISESGALIRIGGKGIPNVQIKLQFNLQNSLIVMFGIVRTAEYNAETNQSLLHFECIHIEKQMQNLILKFVYNLMSSEEKEVYDALALTDQDEKEDIEEQKKEEKVPESNSIEQDININKSPVQNNQQNPETSLQNDLFLKHDSEVDESITLFDDYQKQ